MLMNLKVLKEAECLPIKMLFVQDFGGNHTYGKTTLTEMNNVLFNRGILNPRFCYHQGKFKAMTLCLISAQKSKLIYT